ncbi:MAG: 3-hydroxybutyrate dehydrogenase [Gammaproteobacteria bacterium]|nr:3-hydroxybutyrate dehydrogenase [Gammaproteobacteria bacterium]
MRKSLEGRVALVTGSTSGIGLGIARRLAAEGCTTLMNSHIHETAVDELRREIVEQTGATVEFWLGDMGDVSSIHDMMRAIIADHGNIDILVNNAGIQIVSPIAEFQDQAWDAVQSINLSAAFHTTKAALPLMLKRKWGRIVNIASAHGLVASPFKSAYVAAKHGMVGLTKVTALEGAEHGVTCNAVCPGYVWTPLVEQQIDDQAEAHGISREQVINDVILAPQPTKRFVQVEEVAALTAFLCSDLAASMTGAAIPIDGGWTAR